MVHEFDAADPRNRLLDPLPVRRELLGDGRQRGLLVRVVLDQQHRATVPPHDCLECAAFRGLSAGGRLRPGVRAPTFHEGREPVPIDPVLFELGDLAPADALQQLLFDPWVAIDEIECAAFGAHEGLLLFTN